MEATEWPSKLDARCAMDLRLCASRSRTSNFTLKLALRYLQGVGPDCLTQQ